MLGVKLITLSASRSLSLSRAGVCGLQSAGTVLPRRRVGVVRALILSLLRMLSDFTVRLASVDGGVLSLVVGVVEDVSLLEDRLVVLASIVPSTTLMVALGGQ
jgi:hypothetical protein